MTSPQIENGYTRLANELLEELSKIDIDPKSWRIIMLVWRRTYGVRGRKAALLTGEFISEQTGIRKEYAWRILRYLIFRGILFRNEEREIGFQKDPSKWKKLTRTEFEKLGQNDPQPKQKIKRSIPQRDSHPLKISIPQRDSRVSRNGTVEYPATGQSSFKERFKERKKERIGDFPSGIKVGQNDPPAKKKRKPVNGKSPLCLPDFIDAGLWDDFLEHRKKLRKPMTNRAQEMAWRKIKDIMDDTGEKASDIIERSIVSGWAGFFPRKPTDYDLLSDEDF